MTNIVLGLALVGITALSYGLVAMIRWGALRWKVLDIPNERSAHTLPIPLGGGLALVALNVVGWVLFARSEPILSWQHLLCFAAGGLLIAGVSFLDDLGHVPYHYRFLVQGTAALVVMVGVTTWQTISLPLLGLVPLGGLGLLLTLLWIVGLTNAFNFMDGSDGLAAGQAVVAGLGWMVLGVLDAHRALVVMGGLLAATSAGFLLHNWHPARIFMGDTGSTFLGYTFAVLTLIATRDDPKLALAGVLLVWPVIFDTAFTVTRRLQRGENIFVGHREFLFHRLLASGWHPRAIAGLYMSFPVVGALLAYSWDRGNPVIHAGVAGGLILLCGSLWLLVQHQERGQQAGEGRVLTLVPPADWQPGTEIEEPLPSIAAR